MATPGKLLPKSLLLVFWIVASTFVISADDYWLDETYAESALDWVAKENRKTVDHLGGDAGLAELEALAAEVLTDTSQPSKIHVAGERVLALHQSRSSPLGLWQSADADDYFTGKPTWTTLIDFDRLSSREGRKWLLHSVSCRETRCLVRLSDNGKDAHEVREFDLGSGQFVEDGFFIPEGKSRSWWYDDEHLLVAPILDRASLNESELPRTLRLWKRRTALKETKTLFMGTDSDSGLGAAFLRAGDRDGFIAVRSLDFFTREYHWVDESGHALKLPLPTAIDIKTTFKGKLLIRLNKAYTMRGLSLPSGALVALSLDKLIDEQTIEDVELIYESSSNEGIREVLAIGDKLYLGLLRNYRSVVLELDSTAGWEQAKALALPADGFISLLGVHANALHLAFEAPLQPQRTFLYSPESGAEQALFQQEPLFDASGLSAQLRTTRSLDGTEISYTVIGPSGAYPRSPRPTLVYGYGGFDVSITPRYEPVFGKLWLERGGVYVHAYLRGGGENGPAWHRSAMLDKRLRPYEDMAAVLEDLQQRSTSTPDQTGIIGRSNGGLMVSAVMTLRPELMNAVIVGGPLIDMLHYQNLPPGASWTAEYGDPRRSADAAWIAPYSPLQAVRADDAYPSPLIITSTDDDRVLVGHARRFHSRMGAMGHDSYYFEDRQGGHYWELAGGPAPGDWRLRARARAIEFAYLGERLGLGAEHADGAYSAYGNWPSLKNLQRAIRAGEISPAVLVERQLNRIERLNPTLNAVIAVDPTARAQARALSAAVEQGQWKGALHGIPVLIKDNIETRDQPTTAGSIALAENRTARDAPLVARLREAGAVILGKANLSEWANFRSTRSSSGWSALGGQTRNPYDPSRSACGSSSGSGAAVAAGMAVLAVGTETNGSIVCPSSANGLVGIKPTVGLISRSGIVPISNSQDTAGPMARSVYGATVLLAAMMGGADVADPATEERPTWSGTDLVAHVRADGLQGKRIGILRSLTGLHSEADQLFDEAIVTMSDAGATIIDELEWESGDDYSQQTYEVLLYEFKYTINAYLAGLPDPDLSALTLADLIEFNRAHRSTEMRWFGQEIFEAAQEKGGLEEAGYRSAHAAVRRISGVDGIDRLLREHSLDALIAPTTSPAWTIDRVNGDHYLGGSSSIAAVSGFPNITVPMGQVHGLPVGLSIFGARFSEPSLIEIASGYESRAGGFTPPQLAVEELEDASTR